MLLRPPSCKEGGADDERAIQQQRIGRRSPSGSRDPERRNELDPDQTRSNQDKERSQRKKAWNRPFVRTVTDVHQRDDTTAGGIRQTCPRAQAAWTPC